MRPSNTDDFMDDNFDVYFNNRQRRERQTDLRQRRQPKRSQAEILGEKVEYGRLAQVGAEAVFNPSLNASRHERDWILNYLGPFYDDEHITDVLRKVKGGKEATVYCCAAHPGTGLELIAAKLYRPRMFRNLRNDARYRQGRQILDEQGKAVLDHRQLRAVKKGTKIGKELQHTSWLEHEFQTMQVLHAAGADIPQPLAHGNNVILMEYVGEASVPALTLNQVRLAPDEAQPLFERLLHNVELMLSCGRIHGDLSAYNVLYWQGSFKIIDFPQAIDPRLNSDAYAIFKRDVERVCQYFACYGLVSDPSAWVDQMWERYGESARDVMLDDGFDEFQVGL